MTHCSSCTKKKFFISPRFYWMKVLSIIRFTICFAENESEIFLWWYHNYYYTIIMFPPWLSRTKKWKWKWKFNYDWSIIMGTSYLWFYHDILQFPNSGKPHRIKIHVNLGIAQIAFGLPPHSNGQFLLKIFNSAGPKMCKGNVIWTRQARKPKEIF